MLKNITSKSCSGIWSLLKSFQEISWEKKGESKNKFFNLKNLQWVKSSYDCVSLGKTMFLSILWGCSQTPHFPAEMAQIPGHKAPRVLVTWAERTTSIGRRQYLWPRGKSMRTLPGTQREFIGMFGVKNFWLNKLEVFSETMFPCEVPD